jgi:phosphatidylethanolamine-binding protein (PEBP) family uncharacterized protein
VLAEPAMKQGRNSRGPTGYTGPKPPPDDPAHHYRLQVFALSVDPQASIPAPPARRCCRRRRARSLAASEIVGTFER